MKLFWEFVLSFGMLMLCEFGQSIQHHQDPHYFFRKNNIKLLIFTKKIVPRQVKKMIQTQQAYYDNMFNKLNEYVANYNELSEEDKYIIETIVGLLL